MFFCISFDCPFGCCDPFSEVGFWGKLSVIALKTFLLVDEKVIHIAGSVYIENNNNNIKIKFIQCSTILNKFLERLRELIALTDCLKSRIGVKNAQ